MLPVEIIAVIAILLSNIMVSLGWESPACPPSWWCHSWPGGFQKRIWQYPDARALTRRFWVLPNLFLKRPSGFISVTDFYNSCISMGDAPAASICSATTISLDRDNGQIMSEWKLYKSGDTTAVLKQWACALCWRSIALPGWYEISHHCGWVLLTHTLSTDSEWHQPTALQFNGVTVELVWWYTDDESALTHCLCVT